MPFSLTAVAGVLAEASLYTYLDALPGLSSCSTAIPLSASSRRSLSVLLLTYVVTVLRRWIRGRAVRSARPRFPLCDKALLCQRGGDDAVVRGSGWR